MRTMTCILSTKRSGHHAVIRWLYEGLGTSTVFYNNINGRYAKSGEQTLFGRDGHHHTHAEKRSPSSKSDPGYHIAMNFEGKLPQTVAGILGTLNTASGPAHFEQYIILRDPLNTLASCARHFSPHTRVKNRIKFYEQALALQDLIAEAQTPRHLKPDRLIAYNRWLCEDAYRRQLADTLSMVRTPELPATVTHHGGGSSFSRNTLNDPQALLSRWQAMADDPLFLSVFLDAGCIQAFRAYADLFGDTHAPDATTIDNLVTKARADTQATALYRDWLAPLRTNRDKLAAVQLAVGTPGYIPAKLRLRLAIRLARIRR